MDYDSKIAELHLVRDKKIQELNEKIEKGKIKKQEYINKKVKIDEEIIKWDNKIKIWENEIKEIKDSFYKELQANLGLTSDEMDEALIEKGREKDKLKNKYDFQKKNQELKENKNQNKKIELYDEKSKSDLKNSDEELEDKEKIEEKVSELFD